MSQKNVQFAVASHVMAALCFQPERGMRSADMAESVNADPTLVRRVVSKLAKAGLINTTRGKHGACVLARAPAAISMLDIYRASEAPAAMCTHDYPVNRTCVVSRNVKVCLHDVLADAQASFEKSLAAQTLADVATRIESAG